jgi:hypothetical protein
MRPHSGKHQVERKDQSGIVAAEQRLVTAPPRKRAKLNHTVAGGDDVAVDKFVSVAANLIDLTGEPDAKFISELRALYSKYHAARPATKEEEEEEEEEEEAEEAEDEEDEEEEAEADEEEEENVEEEEENVTSETQRLVDSHEREMEVHQATYGQQYPDFHQRVGFVSYAAWCVQCGKRRLNVVCSMPRSTERCSFCNRWRDPADPGRPSAPDYDPAEPMEDCPSPARTQTGFEGWNPNALLRAGILMSIVGLEEWKEMPPVTDVVPEEATWLSVAQHDQSFLASEALSEALATAHYARLYDVTLSTHSESVPDYDPAEPMEDCPSPARTQTRFEGWIPCAHLRAEK